MIRGTDNPYLLPRPARLRLAAPAAGGVAAPSVLKGHPAHYGKVALTFAPSQQRLLRVRALLPRVARVLGLLPLEGCYFPAR